MANNNFPYEIRDVPEELNKQLTGELKGISKFIQVGPKKYTFPGKYAEEGPLFYNFKVRPDDVWVVTYPRSGTTFTQEMTWLLLNNFDYKKAKEIILDDRFPFLEMSSIVEPNLKAKTLNKNSTTENQQAVNFGANVLDLLDKMQERRFIKSHLPLSLLPPNLLTLGAKVSRTLVFCIKVFKFDVPICLFLQVIYVARNPKDVSVSLYHFFQLMEFYEYTGEFKQFWNYFENNLSNYILFNYLFIFYNFLYYLFFLMVYFLNDQFLNTF